MAKIKPFEEHFADYEIPYQKTVYPGLYDYIAGCNIQCVGLPAIKVGGK